MFEAIFANEVFIDLFNERGSGKRDYSDYNYWVCKYFNDDIKIDLICYLRDVYFKLLVDNKRHFDYLFNMNFDEFVVPLNDENYEIDLTALEETIIVFLENHEEFYKSCVSEITKILTIEGIEC